MPALPPLPAGTTTTANGTLAFTLAPGATRSFDASIASVAPPPCASLAWVAAWRATDPLTGTVVRDSGRLDIGTGRWGTAEMGCASLELRNPGTTTVVGELAYIIGSR